MSSQDDGSDRLDAAAVLRSAGSMACLALPLAIWQRWLIASDSVAEDAVVNWLFVLGYLLCAAVAGFGAAKLAGRRPLPHGAAAGATTYLIVQGIGAIWKIASGRGAPSIVAVVYLGLLMATCGMLGGMLERRTRALR